ncbi:MAG: response regulator transcription factor [Bosea sp. (in: a-proteobacteria)]
MNQAFHDFELDVVIVDDDAAVRDALSVLLEMEGLRVKTFETGEAFLSEARNLKPGCVLMDVHMPGRSGLDILDALGGSSYHAPVVMISGQGDVPMAVYAMKHGAFDFIEKPFDAPLVMARVKDAMARVASNAVVSMHGRLPAFPGHETLTAREVDVLEHIVAGASNKEAGRLLGISPRTIEVHRARIMEKLKARNTAELVRLVYREPARA